MKQIPLLIMSDAPDQNTGLGRIARDLATVVATMPEFRVATLGLGGMGAQHLPWLQYHMAYGYEFGERSLPQVWEDFSEGERGIVFTIFDLGRILWLTRPEFVEDKGLRGWLEGQRSSGSLKVWSYLPIDATGPQNRLTGLCKEALLGIDRVLCYTPWSQQVVVNTIGAEEAMKRNISWMPHAINTRIFKRDPLVFHGYKRIGCVMTNQVRKDWGTVAATCKGIADKLGSEKVTFWWHVDAIERHWNLKALAEDFGLTVEITLPPMTDTQMADRYRSCDLTLLPSSEGFGYCIFESIACGVPCLHAHYAGGASLMNEFGLSDLLIEPSGWRLEGPLNSLRPVHEPQAWVDASLKLLEAPVSAEWLASRVAHLDMKNLGSQWKKWMREGVQFAE